jgi:hypothetical protein
LTWQTAQEQNALYFNIERSFDAVHFNAIGKVNAKGNSANVSSYNFTDNAVSKLNSSILYYRLNEVDKDGKTYLSKTVVVNLNKKIITLRLIPNPVKEKLSVQITNYTGNAVIEIYDVLGRKLYHNNIAVTNSDISINTAPLKAGAFLLQANINGTVLKQKFVKE